MAMLQPSGQPDYVTVKIIITRGLCLWSAVDWIVTPGEGLTAGAHALASKQVPVDRRP